MHLDALEAARQRAVALEVAVLLERGRAHAAQLAVLQERLQHVRRVDRRALRGARAEHGVDLVDEHDRVRRSCSAATRLEALLEVAAIARAREHRARGPPSRPRRPCRSSGTSPSTMRCARPSAIAVLPTPDSPTRIGLFLRRRASTWITRSISASRPTSGSSLPSAARSVRLVANAVSGSATSSSSSSPSPSGFGPARRRAVRARARRDSGSFEIAVRDVLQHVEPRDALRAQQRHGVRVGLLEDRGDEIPRLDLVALGVVGVRERLLDHAVEGERLAGLDRLLAGLALDLVVEVALQVGRGASGSRPSGAGPRRRARRGRARTAGARRSGRRGGAGSPRASRPEASAAALD